MQSPPAMLTNEERVAMATRCRDCDPIPKVLDSGEVFTLADGRQVQLMHNGLKVLAGSYHGQWMLDLIRLCRGHHEAQEERLFHEVEKRLPADATMIELGGFWSYYSLWFLQDQPARKALVIEPEPTHLAVGRANAALNGLEPTFKPGFAGGSFAESVPFATEVSGELPLTRYSVHRLMEEQGWDRLTLLHCDIQGAETEVLESCRDLFTARKIDWVFVSTHAHQVSGDPLTHQRCLAILRECGATIEAEHDVHESFSGDGLIVARFCPAPPGWQPVRLSANRAAKSLYRHLSYDLADERQHRASEQAKLARSQTDHLHPTLQRSGILLTLQADGPLGHAGDTLALPDDLVISPDVRRDSVWDANNLKAFVARLPRGKTYSLLDVGANIGLFSRQLAYRTGQLDRIFCVEPDSANLAALRHNMSAFADRLHVAPIALGKDDGAFEFFRDRENIGNFSLNPDAMRDRPFDCITVPVRSTEAWMRAHLSDAPAILWKSDTQGSDEVIVSLVPMDIWERVDVALMEMWRIDKAPYDRLAFRARLESFPNRKLGDREGVSPDDVLAYLDANDARFTDLLMWR